MNENNRPIHYDKTKKKNTSDKDTMTLKELALELYPNLAEITAYRKTSKQFEKVCRILGVNPQKYRPGRNYQIPKGSKMMWMLLLRNVEVIEGDSNDKNFLTFVEDIKETKELMDERLSDQKDAEAKSDSFVESMTSVYEMFYTPSQTEAELLSLMLQDELIKEIHRDFEYIRKKAPEDRVVLYSEMYKSNLHREVKKMGELVRTMIKEKWYEKRGNER